MPSINTTPPSKRNPTRRSMLGALAAGSALAAAPALAVAKPTSDDDHLFNLIREMHTVRLAIKDADDARNDDRVESLWEKWDRLEGRVAATAPTTAAGIAVKIRLYLADGDIFDPDNPSALKPELNLIDAVLADLDRMTGGAA